jgi:hypothetical protein
MTRSVKHEAIRPLLLEGAIWKETADCFNCLPPETRERYEIVDTANISAHGYDPFAQAIVSRFRSGWVLDCGAGMRADFLPNVVNLEIVAYPSTDVLGAAEELPFRDNSFDGVLCMNVLEHVKDPFRAAAAQPSSSTCRSVSSRQSLITRSQISRRSKSRIRMSSRASHTASTRRPPRSRSARSSRSARRAPA